MSARTIVDADLRDFLPTLVDKSIDLVVVDPPYSEKVHKSVRSAKRNIKPDVAEFKCRTRRVVDLGFASLDASTRRFCAREFARLSKRWVMAFSDVESCHLWRRSFEANGLDYCRTMEWRRLGGAPQFTGDRPSSSFEAITLAHPKGKKSWHGGGKMGCYEFPIVANRLGERGSRVHPTQKPEELMLSILTDFANPGDTVLDCFMGSGTTAAAAWRLGLNFIGCDNGDSQATGERWADVARQRIAAMQNDSTMSAARAGQLPIFDRQTKGPQ